MPTIPARVQRRHAEEREPGTLVKVGFCLGVGFVVFGWLTYAALHRLIGL
jgi:hypothetical protein